MNQMEELNPRKKDLRVDIAIGYVYFLNKNHPLATGAAGRVYMHRHVASVAAGRWVTRNEHVHHIDENPKNNKPDNLQILSPREHSYKHHEEIPSHPCKRCGESTKNYLYCSYECSRASTRKVKNLPSKEELAALIETTPAWTIGEKYGVSGNAVKKWIDKYGLTAKPRGYWMKLNAVVSELDIEQAS